MSDPDPDADLISRAIETFRRKRREGKQRIAPRADYCQVVTHRGKVYVTLRRSTTDIAPIGVYRVQANGRLNWTSRNPEV